jgi:predicted Zn finger-like uncharacterized protein
MSNSDILSKADKVLRPVLKELSQFSWVRIEGCCAGHKQEDTLWLETSVLGATGLARLRTLLNVLDTKLAGTDIRVDCLLSYATPPEDDTTPHGWIPIALEVSWAPRPEWKRSQNMIVEALLSSIEEVSPRLSDMSRPECAINYCPYCASSFIRIDSIGAPEHKYRCGDCDMTWTMIDPVV